jgi:hypothetical protein
MAPVPDGGGYWLVAADGGLFAFGDAGFFGSAAGLLGEDRATGMVPTRTGLGYLIVTAGGQVFSQGDAPDFGDLLTVLGAYAGRVVAVAPTPG